MKSLTKIQNQRKQIVSGKSLRKLALADERSNGSINKIHELKTSSKSSCSLKKLSLQNHPISLNPIKKHSINYIQVNKLRCNERKRNILKFESNINQIDPTVKHIFEKNHPKTCNDIQLPSHDPKIPQQPNKQTTSLKSIRSAEHINFQSPESATNIFHQSIELHPSKQTSLKKIQLKRLKLSSKWRQLMSGKKDTNHHNTSIVAETNRDQKENQDQNEKFQGFNHENLKLEQNTTEKKQLERKSLSKIVHDKHNADYRLNWERASLDDFQQKLKQLMVKAKRNSVSRIQLMSIKYHQMMPLTSVKQ